MVFLTAVNLVRQVTKFGRPGGGVDKFWRVQQILRCAWVWHSILVLVDKLDTVCVHGRAGVKCEVRGGKMRGTGAR